MLAVPRLFVKTTNAYLVQSGGASMLIDCGAADEASWSSLLDQLEALEIAPATLSRVVITHAHSDHAGASRRLSELGVPVLISRQDMTAYAARVDPTVDHTAMLSRWLHDAGIPAEESRQLERALVGREEPDAFTATHLLEPDEIITLGDLSLRVLMTPGHTPGHICLVDSEGRFIFVGDHILPEVAPNVSMGPLSTDNPLPGYLKSLEHLRDSGMTAYAGHGGSFSLERRAQQILDHQWTRQAAILEALSPGPRTPYELAHVIWGHDQWAAFAPFLKRNAVGLIVAHLDLLRTQGRAMQQDVRWSVV